MVRLGQLAHELREMRWGRARVLWHELPELVVEAGYQAPLARTTAGIVFNRIERSRKTDQRSR